MKRFGEAPGVVQTNRLWASGLQLLPLHSDGFHNRTASLRGLMPLYLAGSYGYYLSKFAGNHGGHIQIDRIVWLRIFNFLQ